MKVINFEERKQAMELVELKQECVDTLNELYNLLDNEKDKNMIAELSKNISLLIDAAL